MKSNSGSLRAGRPSDRLHDRHPNQGCGDGTQKMRSIARVKGGKSPRAAGSTTSGPTEIFWGKPMPGTANGRGPGKGGCIMISLRLALGRLEDRRLPNRVCPQKAADVLGADLNCSKSRCCCGTPAGPCPSWVDAVERILTGVSRATLISRSRANSKLCGRHSPQDRRRTPGPRQGRDHPRPVFPCAAGNAGVRRPRVDAPISDALQQRNVKR